MSEFSIQSTINALIVMHGKENAKTIARTTNAMIGDYVFDYFEMPLLIDTSEIIKEIVNYTRKVNTDNGLVILVDMGSLEKIYSSIKGNVRGDLVVMNNVSTALSLEIASKLTQHATTRQLEKMNLEPFKVNRQYFEGVSQKPNILVSCLSGEGIAQKIKDILQHYLTDDVEVLTINYNYLQKKCDEMDDVFFKNTLLIITTPEIDVELFPVVSVEDIVRDNHSLSLLINYMDEESIKNCCNDILKLFTIEGAAARLTILNPERVIDEVGEVINSYEKYYNLEFPNFVRINLFVHMSAMIERMLKYGDTENKEFVVDDSEEFKKFCTLSDIVFETICKKYNISIPKSEYGLVYQLVNQHV